MTEVVFIVLVDIRADEYCVSLCLCVYADCRSVGGVVVRQPAVLSLQ